MRLHLPKRLLHAVIASLVTASAALCTLGSAAYAGHANGVFYINPSEDNAAGSMDGYASFENGVYTYVNTDPTGKTAVTSIQPGDSLTGEITTLKVASGKQLEIKANQDNSSKKFTDLVISSVEVTDSGSAKLIIDGAQVVSIGGATGTVNFEAKSSGAAQLIFNGNGTYGTYTTIGNIDNYARKISVTNSSIVSFTTITNSWGMGAIDVETGSKLTANTISFKTGNNTGTDGQGGKITGAGTVEVTTFDAGNVGSYTVSVDNFSATTINAGCAADRTLTLSSSNLTIGTLNHTSGKLVISSGVTAKITNLNLSGGTFTNSGAIEFQTGAMVTLDRSFALGYTVGDRPTSGNGFGTITGWSVDLSSYIQGSGSLTGADTTTWKLGTQELAYSSDTGMLSADSVQTLTYIVQQSDTISDAMNGATSIQIYGEEGSPTTLKLDGSLPGTIKRITANADTIYDVYGVPDKDSYELILNGGKLTNSSSEIGAGKKQLCQMSLTANSTLEATSGHTFGYVANQYGDATLNLGGFTLTKTGDGEFYTANTTLRGGGTLKITNGKFTLGVTHQGSVKTSYLGHTDDKDNTNIWLTSGELAGSFVVQRDAEIKAEAGSGTVSASITLASGKTATLKATGESDILTVSGGVLSGEGKVSIAAGSGKVLLNGNNTYTGGTTMEGGTLVAGHANALGTGALSVTSTIAKSTLDVASGVTLGVSRILVGETKQVEGEKTTTPSALDIKGSTSVSNYVDLTAGSSLTVKQDASLSLTGTGGGEGIWMKTGSTVTIEKGASVSAFGFTIANSSDTTNATLTLAEGKDNANLGQNAQNSDLVINDADVTITGTYELKSKINGGTLTSNVQGARASGNINVSTLTVNAEKSLALGGETTVTGGATVSGALEIQSTGSLSVGADSTISTLTGSGTLKANGGWTIVTSASGFSGAVESGSMLSIGGVKNLETLKAAGNGQVWATTGTDDSSNVITSITIDEIVLTGGTASVTYTADEATHNAAIETNSLVVSAGSALTADLTLADSASLVVNVGGITADTSTPVCTLSGTLTLGSELTLTLENLGILKEGQSLTLFTGVTDFTYQGTASVAALSDEDVTTGTVVSVDASEIFSNVDSGYFKVKYDGTNVLLTASKNVPEPTTATLSLLALMGLAARRRRRKA